MTIDALNDELYDDVYSDILTREDRHLLDTLNIEWRGRNIAQIRQDIRILGILAAVKEYQESAEKNSTTKARLITVLQGMLTDPAPDPVEYPHVYRQDPISCAYLEIPSEMRSGLLGIVKGWAHDIAHGSRHLVRNVNHWVSNNTSGTAQVSMPLHSTPNPSLPTTPRHLPPSHTPRLSTDQQIPLPTPRPLERLFPSSFHQEPAPSVFAPSHPHPTHNYPEQLPIPRSPLPQTILPNTVPSFHFAHHSDTALSPLGVPTPETEELSLSLAPVSEEEQPSPPENGPLEVAKTVARSFGAEVTHLLVDAITLLPRGIVQLMDIVSHVALPGEPTQLSPQTEEFVGSIHIGINRFFNHPPTQHHITKLEMPLPAAGLSQRVTAGAAGANASRTTKLATETLKDISAVERAALAVPTSELVVPVRVQPNGIWEIEGKNIKRFDSNIVSDKNKVIHIFNNPEHQVDKFASTPQVAFEKVTTALIKADQEGGIPLNQPFVARVKIDGHLVEVRGIVNEGELKIGTFFVPNG